MKMLPLTCRYQVNNGEKVIQSNMYLKWKHFVLLTERFRADECQQNKMSPVHKCVCVSLWGRVLKWRSFVWYCACRRLQSVVVYTFAGGEINPLGLREEGFKKSVTSNMWICPLWGCRVNKGPAESSFFCDCWRVKTLSFGLKIS